jgi:hypothetical protein
MVSTWFECVSPWFMCWELGPQCGVERWWVLQEVGPSGWSLGHWGLTSEKIKKVLMEA